MTKTGQKCLICGNNDIETVYIHCVAKGVESVVCATCMPVLIHGSQAGHDCH